MSTQGIELALQQIALALNPLINPSMVIDGWIPLINETWVYASATTITVPAGASGRYTTGDKIRLVQSGTTKYFYVVSTTDTVLTVTGGTDYTVANATIESPAFSKHQTPIGFPHWFSWTPTWSGMTIGNATVNAKFAIIGESVVCRFSCALGSTSSISSLVSFTLPVTGDAIYASSNIVGVGTCHILDNGTQTYLGNVELTSTTLARILAWNSAGTYVAAVGFSSTAPFTWVAGDQFNGSFVYQIA